MVSLRFWESFSFVGKYPTLVPARRNSKRERRQRSDKSVRSDGGRERLTAKRRWDGAASSHEDEGKRAEGVNSKGTEERKEIAVREFELLCARFRATFGNGHLFHALYPSSVGSTKSEEDIGGFDTNRIPFSFRGKLLLNETPLYATSLSLKILHEQATGFKNTQLICNYLVYN